LRRVSLGVVIAALLFVSATADAHTRKFSTGGSVGAHYVNNTVSGKVTSQKDECVAGRLVTVRVDGNFYGQDFSVLNGDWSVAGSDIDGSEDIDVTVSRKVLKKTATHSHVCKKHVTEV